MIPYVVFRARGYSNTQLNLRSSDRRNDLLVIGVILLIETAAWVHVWAYHAIAPHVTVDTVTITHVFDLR